MKARYNERIPLNSSVTFSIGSVMGHGWVLNVTSPGCLIESPVTVTKGEYLQLKMYLPGLKSPIAVKLAGVRWTKGNQFGVEFIRMADSDRRILEGFMTHLCFLMPSRGKRDKYSDAAGQNWHLQTYSMVHRGQNKT